MSRIKDHRPLVPIPTACRVLMWREWLGKFCLRLGRIPLPVAFWKRQKVRKCNFIIITSTGPWMYLWCTGGASLNLWAIIAGSIRRAANILRECSGTKMLMACGISRMSEWWSFKIHRIAARRWLKEVPNLASVGRQRLSLAKSTFYSITSLLSQGNHSQE